jgi:transposase
MPKRSPWGWTPTRTSTSPYSPGRDRQASGHPERAGEPGSYKSLVDWAEEFGPLKHAGVEGTGSFGAGLSRLLKGRRIKVCEVIRPKRRDQYRAGKSDPIDAEAAARAVVAGTATGQPKSADGEVEMIRTLRITRRSALKARVGAANQLQNLLSSALQRG